MKPKVESGRAGGVSLPDIYMSPAEALIETVEYLNEVGATNEGRPFLARDILANIPELNGYQGEVMVFHGRSGRPVHLFLQAEDYDGNVIFAYEVRPNGDIVNITAEKRVHKARILRLNKYFKVQSVEEGLYAVIKDVAAGKLSREDLLRMGGFLNSFPPVDYFTRHIREFTPEACEAMLAGIDSPEAFKSTEIFHKIMSDEAVVRRFRLITSEQPRPLPTWWPAEHRTERDDEGDHLAFALDVPSENAATGTVAEKRRTLWDILRGIGSANGRSGGGNSMSLH